jgi:hypothetical protein
VSLEDVYRNWVVSEDPQVHAQAIQKLLDRGATNVFIHSGQSDQQRVIGFYAHEVLPQLRRLTHVA